MTNGLSSALPGCRLGGGIFGFCYFPPSRTVVGKKRDRCLPQFGSSPFLENHPKVKNKTGARTFRLAPNHLSPSRPGVRIEEEEEGSLPSRSCTCAGRPYRRNGTVTNQWHGGIRGNTANVRGKQKRQVRRRRYGSSPSPSLFLSGRYTVVARLRRL